MAFRLGDKFGSRELISDYFISETGRVSYLFRCTECGLTGKMSQGLLRQSISCCDNLRYRGRDMLRVVWDDMHSRCCDSKHPQYSRYGGRGIGVGGWKSYAEFKEWALNQNYLYLNKYDLDRIDNDLGYSLSNCRFVPRKMNSENRSSTKMITAFGETLPLPEWSRRTGISPGTIIARLDRYGWTPEKALSQDVRKW